MQERKKLGEIFVEKGILTQKTVDRVLARANKIGRRFGTLLEDFELITGEELADALASQYGCKVVSNIAAAPIEKELLEMISVEVAMENLLFPLKREKGRLALAMADPTNTKIVGNIAANNGLTIIPFIATRKDIHAAICKHYLGRPFNPSPQRTVLVVEDDKMVLNVLIDMLAKHKYRAVGAMDGFEAFKKVISEKPQVVITDKEMPRLDGYGLLNALKNAPDTRCIPVILITSSANPLDESKAFEKGFFDFITKPVNDVTLITRVRRACQFFDNEYKLY